jgi:cytochrome c
MSAHPQLSIEQTKEMVHFILGFKPKKENPTLPSMGSIALKIPAGEVPGGTWVFNTSYADKGALGMPSLSGIKTTVLSPNQVETENYYHSKDVGKRKTAGKEPIYMEFKKPDSYFTFKPIDLYGISAITVNTAAETEGGFLEFRADTTSGPLLATYSIPTTGGWDKWLESKKIPVTNKLTGIHKLFVIYKLPTIPALKRNLCNIDWIRFDFNKPPAPRI